MSQSFLLTGSACAFALLSASTSSSAYAATITTGEYHTTITITSLTGLPDVVAQGMMNHPHSVDDCIATGDLNQLLHEQLAANADMTCSENKSTAAGGHLSGRATCHDSEGASGKMTFKGIYTSTHIEVYAHLSGHLAMGPFTEGINFVSDWTGKCN